MRRAMILLPLCALLLAPLGGCTREVKDAPASAAATPAPANRWLLKRAADDAAAPAGVKVLLSAPGSSLLLVNGQQAPTAAGWRVLTRLTESQLAKVNSRLQLLSQLEAAGGADPAVSCFLRIGKDAAPADEDALRAGLTAAGFRPATVAGDVVTGAVPAGRLADLLALSWVTHVEVTGPVKLRK